MSPFTEVTSRAKAKRADARAGRYTYGIRDVTYNSEVTYGYPSQICNPCDIMDFGHDVLVMCDIILSV